MAPFLSFAFPSLTSRVSSFLFFVAFFLAFQGSLCKSDDKPTTDTIQTQVVIFSLTVSNQKLVVESGTQCFLHEDYAQLNGMLHFLNHTLRQGSWTDEHKRFFKYELARFKQPITVHIDQHAAPGVLRHVYCAPTLTMWDIERNVPVLLRLIDGTDACATGIVPANATDVSCLRPALDHLLADLNFPFCA